GAHRPDCVAAAAATGVRALLLCLAVVGPGDALHDRHDDAAVADLLVVQVYREVVLGGGVADHADLLASGHLRALADRAFGQVGVPGLPATAVVDHDGVAVPGVGGVVRLGDGAARAGQDRLADLLLARV